MTDFSLASVDKICLLRSEHERKCIWM